jgi:Flp pilus assembly protein TadB
MKIYIKQLAKGAFSIAQETTLQTVITDLSSVAVVLALIAADVAFSLLVAHSFVIDVFVCLVLIASMRIQGRKKFKVKSMDELLAVIKEF